MRRIRNCVLIVAAAALGFVDSGAMAREGDPDPTQVQDAVRSSPGWAVSSPQGARSCPRDLSSSSTETKPSTMI